MSSKAPDFPKIKSGRTRTVALVMVAGLLAVALSACGELTPSGDTSARQLVINEVFTGTITKAGSPQYIELLNNTDDVLPLTGYTIETPHGSIDLGTISANSPVYGKGLSKGGVVVVSNYPQTFNTQINNLLKDNARDATAAAALKPLPLGLEDRKVMGQLNPENEVIALKGPDGRIMDQVGWGNIDPAIKSSLGMATNLNLDKPAPKSDTQSLGRTPHFNQRPPKDGPDGKPVADPGAINPGEFTLHNTPTPGLNTTPRIKSTFDFFFASFTDTITTFGAILLWAAFFVIALVARRFETLSEQKTYWQYLMAAPAGILIYAVLQVQDFIRNGSLSDFWSWPAFLALFISGVACVYVVNIFRLIAKNILQAE